MIKIRLLTFYEKNITSKFYKRYYEEKKISWKSLEILLKYIWQIEKTLQYVVLWFIFRQLNVTIRLLPFDFFNVEIIQFLYFSFGQLHISHVS
jgi:hypothetical protein